MSNPYQPPTSPDHGREPYPGAGPADPYGSGGGYLSPADRGYGAGLEHPQGTLILVLGIVGLVFPVAAPFAWVLGSRVLRDIRASGIPASNQQLVVIGRILGIVVTVLMVLGIVLGLILVVLAATVASEIH